MSIGVSTAATADAFMALLRGEGEMVETVLRGTLRAQIEVDNKRAEDQALQAGSDAIRAFLGR